MRTAHPDLAHPDLLRRRVLASPTSYADACCSPPTSSATARRPSPDLSSASARCSSPTHAPPRAASAPTPAQLMVSVGGGSRLKILRGRTSDSVVTGSSGSDFYGRVRRMELEASMGREQTRARQRRRLVGGMAESFGDEMGLGNLMFWSK